MPFNKRTVEPICLSQVQVPKDIPNELECVANHTLANVIRQLSSLSVHSQDLFDELVNDIGHIFQRTEALHNRIERLGEQVVQLDFNDEEVNIQDVHNRKPFDSVTRIDQQVVNRATMPPSLHLLYEQAESAPALHLLNPYRDDGRDSMKFYTDPSFFFNLWMQSMMQYPQSHNGHRSGKHDRHRSSKEYHQESIYASNPTSSSQSRLIQQTTEEQQFRNTIRSHQQIYSSPNHRSDLMQYRTPLSSTYEQQSMTMNFSSSTPESSIHPYNGFNAEQSPRLNVYSHGANQELHTPSPPPPLLLSQFEPTNHTLQHSMMRQQISRRSDSPPPPPPPPPVLAIPSHMEMVTLATISEIDDLPPPPADFIERSPSPPPPPPPLPSNIPPAPPLPNSTIQSLVIQPSTNLKISADRNSTDNASLTSETSIQNQRPAVTRDLHSDLLDEIRKGIQLNNRKKEEEEKKAAVTSKTTSLNVMAIMEQAAKYRRDKIRPQSESDDDDDESSRWDDSE